MQIICKYVFSVHFLITGSSCINLFFLYFWFISLTPRMWFCVPQCIFFTLVNRHGSNWIYGVELLEKIFYIYGFVSIITDAVSIMFTWSIIVNYIPYWSIVFIIDDVYFLCFLCISWQSFENSKQFSHIHSDIVI